MAPLCQCIYFGAWACPICSIPARAQQKCLVKVKVVAFYYPGWEDDCDRLCKHGIFGNFYPCDQGDKDTSLRPRDGS
eukprot:3725439-Amphidinium_carterae.1